MNVIKVGYFDKRGMPMDWWIDSDKSERPKSAVMTLDGEGKVYVDGVEVVVWTNTNQEERKKTLEKEKELAEFYKDEKKQKGK